MISVNVGLEEALRDVLKSGNGTFSCGSSLSYVALSLYPRRSTSRIPRSRTAPSLADPRLPLLIYIVPNVWWIADQHEFDPDL